MGDIYSEIVALRAAGSDCALCTIVSTKGSTPGKEMMKMLVRADGSFLGTVGGGCLEAEVLEAALESMLDERPRMLEFSLNERDYPDSGLLCGGKLSIYVEPITEPKLYLFGGGHVSAAIAQVAVPCGFHVSVGDDRAEFATKARHPLTQVQHCAPFEEQARSIAPAKGMYLVVCTRGHDRDGEVLEALFAARCEPRYLGMIGSRAKRETLFQKLRAAGISEPFLGRIQCPMGLDIGARTHPEIALSVVAELVRLRRLGPTPPTP